MIRAIGAVLVVPMFLLNSLAGIVGGAWLLWLGDWKLVLAALVVVCCVPLWATVLLMPGLILAAPGLAAFNKGYSSIGAMLTAISALWTYVVVAGWCIAAFWYVPQYWDTGKPVVPFLLFAYSVATGPWAVMAQKEVQGGGGESGQLTLAAACFGSALVLCYSFIAQRPAFETAIWFIVVPMACAYILSLVIAVLTSRSGVRYDF